MCQVIDINEYRKRKQLPQFIDLDKVMARSVIEQERLAIVLQRLKKYCMDKMEE